MITIACEPWLERAACVGMDVAAFYSEAVGDAARAEVDRAKQVCATCPVIRECRDAVMKLEGNAGRGYRFGVWGGLTRNERDDLARQVSA